MRIKLTIEEAVFLKDALDIWIEGYKDIDGEMSREVLIELLHNREMAEKIRGKVWRRARKG